MVALYNVFPTNNFENYDLKAPGLFYAFIFLMSFTRHPHVICMRLYFTYMYAYAIRMSAVCTRMSPVCHLYVVVCNGMSLVCHLYVTRMYSYVIRMSLVCTGMSSVCHSSVVLPGTIKSLKTISVAEVSMS